MQLEAERKYIMALVPQFAADYIYSIFQYYTGEARYRAQTDLATQRTTFFKTIKTALGPGVNQEDESEITQTEFYQLLRFATKALNKIRYVYLWRGGKFEFDVFNHIPNLVLMEVELEHIDQKFNMPIWIESLVQRDVTGQKEYSNFEMALVI